MKTPSFLQPSLRKLSAPALALAWASAAFAQLAENTAPAAPPAPVPTAPPGSEAKWDEPKLIPALEKDLPGTYIQIQTGGLLEILAGGKILGYPTSGNYKFLEPGKLEMYGRQKNGGEERTPMRVFNTPQGLGLVRNVDGEDEPTNLVRLLPTSLEPEKWQGPAVIHLLVAMDKKAVKRNVKLDKEGYFRTPEGGYYFRLYKGVTGSVLGYSTEAGAPTVSLRLFKAGNMLVAFDDLLKPKLLTIVQLDAKLDKPAELPKPEK